MSIERVSLAGLDHEIRRALTNVMVGLIEPVERRPQRPWPERGRDE
jgi:hypothetical protein